MSLEERVARIEAVLEQMDKRLNHLESELRELRSEFMGELRELRGRMDERFDSLFKWSVGLTTAVWATVLTLMLPILLKLLGVI